MKACLSFTGRPTSLDILQVPANKSVLVGSSVVFECLVDSVPAPKISWERIGGLSMRFLFLPPTLFRSLPSITGGRISSAELIGSNLRLKSVQKFEEGFYGCRVQQDESGESELFKAYLSVECKRLVID